MIAGSRNRIKTCKFLTQICEYFDKNLKYFFSFISQNIPYIFKTKNKFAKIELQINVIFVKKC